MSALHYNVWRDIDLFYYIILVYVQFFFDSIITKKRVTIMIDDDLDKKLRLRQAKMIQQEQSSYSYSRVVNDTLRKALK